jgi:hypothetical protein
VLESLAETMRARVQHCLIMMMSFTGPGVRWSSETRHHLQMKCTVEAAPWMQGNATRSVAPVCEAEVIAHSAGHGTSTAFCVNAFADSDTAGPQVFHIAFVEKVAHLRTRPSRHSRPEWPGSESAWESRIEKNRSDY